MKKKICVVTGSRAEYGLLKFLIIKLKNDQSIETKLAVTGSHLSKEHGLTSKEIIKDKVKIDVKIFLDLENDNKIDIAQSTSLSIKRFSNFFSKNNFDLVVLNGDRYEIFGAAISAYFFNIKIAHFHGGELTEGLIDEGIRHSITKMSHYHFVSTRKYQNRVAQLGENKKNIFFVGALSLDNISKYKFLSKKKLEEKLDFKFKKINFIFTYHPLTLESNKSKNQIISILKALDKFQEVGIIFTKSNADTDSKIISKLIDIYVKKNKDRCKSFDSLGSFLYFSTIKQVQCVIGNSSSGIIEVPSFKIPTVNIGSRQSGREKSKSIIDVPCNTSKIVEGIKKSLSKKFMQTAKNNSNPYFKKNTINSCYRIIKNINLKDDIKKKFNDIKI